MNLDSEDRYVGTLEKENKILREKIKKVRAMMDDSHCPGLSDQAEAWKDEMIEVLNKE